MFCQISILGLSTLITVPDNTLTPELQDGLPQILSGIIKLLIAYKDQEEKQDEVCVSQPRV